MKTRGKQSKRKQKQPNPKLTRPPWERMLQIHEQLQEKKYPNTETLALDLGVSSRTLKRDIDFMRDRLNLPLDYDAVRHGYYYTKPVDKFPGVAITEQEMFALFVANKAIEQYQGTPFHKPLQMAFEKIVQHLDTGTSYSVDNLHDILSFRPFAPEETDARNFQAITRALQKSNALKFCYRNLGTQTPKLRHAYPYHLACIDNHWYLFAHDVNRNDIRTFVLGRMSHLLETDEKFSRSADFNLDEYLDGSFNVMKRDGDYRIVIEFDAWGTDLLRGRRWHPSQQLEERPDGTSQLRLRLNALEEIERWILSWQTHARVVEPVELACRIKQTAAAIVGLY